MIPLSTQANDRSLWEQAKKIGNWLNNTSNWMAVTNLAIGILNADLVFRRGKIELFVSSVTCIYTGIHLLALKKRDYRAIALLINALCLYDYFQQINTTSNLMSVVNIITIFGDYYSGV